MAILQIDIYDYSQELKDLSVILLLSQRQQKLSYCSKTALTGRSIMSGCHKMRSRYHCVDELPYFTELHQVSHVTTDKQALTMDMMLAFRNAV